MMAPTGVPDTIIQKVNADLRKVVTMPDVQEKMHTLGTYSRDLTPAQTGEFIESEQKLWWPIVREVNKQK
jgi:tripartite-type tricarboxylate transporter receptor subunit TctC